MQWLVEIRNCQRGSASTTCSQKIPENPGVNQGCGIAFPHADLPAKTVRLEAKNRVFDKFNPGV